MATLALRRMNFRLCRRLVHRVSISTEGQRSPGRVDIVQVGNLKSLFQLLRGTSHPCMLKDELVGKSSSLVEQSWSSGKNE